MARKILFAICFTITLSCAALIYIDGATLAKIGQKMPHYLIEKSWQNARATGENAKPWPWFGSHPVAKLTFPDRHESFVVMQGQDSHVLSYAPGWHDGTDLPGEAGISLISGRRDLQFGFLRDLNAGTIFELETLEGKTTAYYVDNLIVTRVGEIHVPVSGDESILLLSASYPSENWQDDKALKYVVVAREYKAPPQMTSEMAPNVDAPNGTL